MEKKKTKIIVATIRQKRKGIFLLRDRRRTVVKPA
jgi:hypothetical protein